MSEEGGSSNGCGCCAVVMLLLLAPGLLGVVLMLGIFGAGSSECGGGGSAVTASGPVPEGSVAGYSGDQLANAGHVLAAGEGLGLNSRDQTIGVMTAMGESTLEVIDKGDAAGPDSRGLFQQRANGAWGTYSDRMDPQISATNFFKAMMKVSNREGRTPTQVAHLTQRNADPNHYTKYWDAAVKVVEFLAGKDLPELEAAAGGQTCTGKAPTHSPVNAQGFAKPADGPVTSRQGPRTHPITGAFTNHAGTDIAGECESPIYAVQDGEVTYAGPARGYGHYVEIDHGEGFTSRYAHMYANGVMVKVGDKVESGKQIGRIGSDGDSTGCHLHLEMRAEGKLVDPEKTLKLGGIELPQQA